MLRQLRRLNNFEPFIKEMSSMLSMEKLEEAFGIVIKKSASSKQKFNLYKNGKLIFAELTENEIIAIAQNLVYEMSKIISDKATEDTDTEEVAKRIAEQECEKNEYRICSKCGKRVHKDDFHFHPEGVD